MMHFLRAGFVFIAAILALAQATHAMDQVMLRNGTRVSGTILAQSKDRVIMRVGEGNAVYSKKAIWRIYEDITDHPPETGVLKRDALPPFWIPLSDLYHEDWVNSLKSVKAGPVTEEPLHNVPYVSFRANTIYEMNIYGNPADPAGLEIGYYGNMWFHSKDAQKRCRQFLSSYLTGLNQLQAVYKLNASGGREMVSGLTIEITPNVYGGWWIAAWNPAKMDAARCKDEAAWKLACEKNLAIIKQSTAGKTEWMKYSLKDAAKRYLPIERMMEQ
ncbi:MAG: hypothetical protein ACREKL_00440 [Chthoniobacterales bacterium]